MGDRAAGPRDDDSGSCKEKENAATVQLSRKKQDVMPPRHIHTLSGLRILPRDVVLESAALNLPRWWETNSLRRLGLTYKGDSRDQRRRQGLAGGWGVSEVATGAALCA